MKRASMEVKGTKTISFFKLCYGVLVSQMLFLNPLGLQEGGFYTPGVHWEKLNKMFHIIQKRKSCHFWRLEFYYSVK